MLVHAFRHLVMGMIPNKDRSPDFVLWSTRSFFGCFGDRRNNIEYHCYYVAAWGYYIGTDFQWWLCFFFPQWKVINYCCYCSVMTSVLSQNLYHFIIYIYLSTERKCQTYGKLLNLLLKTFTVRTSKPRPEENVFFSVCVYNRMRFICDIERDIV